LIQAYGECAKQTIQHAKILEAEITRTISFTYTFDLVPIVRNILNKYSAKIIQETYDKEVEMEIGINS
jgi:putative IMPACT (imprinted ancient) family translation regulator